MNNFKFIKNKIDKITKNAPHIIENKHSNSTLKWVLKLKPDADLTLKIAALCHDIDRSFPKRRIDSRDFNDYSVYKKIHAEQSAKITSELMQELAVDKKIINQIEFLIRNHEIGKRGDSRILKEADSLSFFEDNLLDYNKRNPKYLKDKIRMMYTRLPKRARILVSKMNFEGEEIKKVVKEIISQEEK